MRELQIKRCRQSLNEQELQKVGAVLLQWPVTQALKQTQRKKAQQVKQAKRYSRDTGMAL